MNKDLARALIKDRLLNLKNKDELDALIASNFMELKEYKSYFIYNSIKSEVDTKKIINYLLDKKKDVYLPVCEDKNMYLVKIDKDTVYKNGPFNILEPIGQKVDINSACIDVCVTPLLAYDKNLNRLGKGGGFYDRFFEKAHCLKVGLAYSAQYIDIIDVDKWDIKLDILINEKGLYESN